jgi:hypothetical protein
VDAADATQPATSAPLLDDQPSTVDLLNYGQFAAALCELASNPATKTPFIVGIFGRWGTGKTTLMRMLQRQLDEREVTTVWFSAWVYAREDEIWAALLQSIATRLTGEMRLAGKTRYALRLFERSLAWDRLLYEGPKYLVGLLLLALPVIVGGLLAEQVGPAIARWLNAAGIVGTVAVGMWYVVKPGGEAALKDAHPDFTLYRSMDFEKHVGFLDRFREQFGRIVDALPGKARRLVIFIDDIDRCSPDQALQLLDAIKVFLDVPRTVFILGLDQAVIEQALVVKYPTDLMAQREYMSKLVQLPFHLPPLTQDDLVGYLQGLDVGFPDARCRDVFLSCLPRNPREIKRVINSYSLSWYLAKAAQAELSPVRLAKVIVIQQAFGRLFALLREQPDWLGVLERALREQAGTPIEMPEDDTSAAITMVRAPNGGSVPPAMTPYLQEAALQKLLTMHMPSPAPEDDATFAYLSGEQLGLYFTLTRRIAHAPSTPGQSAAAAAGVLGSATSSGDQRMVWEDGKDYEIVSVLGRGGSGVTYEAEDRRAGRRVAIKCLAATLSDDPTWIARFRRETGLLAKVTAHPNIVDLLDSGTGKDASGQAIVYFVTELVKGDTLAAVLERDVRLSPTRARITLAPIFDAVGHLHACGILHRDIKPTSILVATAGQPKLIDFGLAVESLAGDDQYTTQGTVLGTPAYMSPEQFMGTTLGPASDLFSLGIVIYECLTGERAFTGGLTTIMHKVLYTSPIPPSELNPALPRAIDDFFAKILARNATARFADAASAKAAFIQAIGSSAAPVAAQ